MINLDTLKKLAEAATPGPWNAESWEKIIRKLFDDAPTSVIASATANGFAQARADAEYIAAMSPDVCLGLISIINDFCEAGKWDVKMEGPRFMGVNRDAWSRVYERATGRKP